MSQALKAGDRVRVRSENRFYGYRPGDKGTVLRAAPLARTGTPHYLVAMDRDGPGGTAVIFSADDIEPDV